MQSENHRVKHCNKMALMQGVNDEAKSPMQSPRTVSQHTPLKAAHNTTTSPVEH